MRQIPHATIPEKKVSAASVEAPEVKPVAWIVEPTGTEHATDFVARIAREEQESAERHRMVRAAEAVTAALISRIPPTGLPRISGWSLADHNRLTESVRHFGEPVPRGSAENSEMPSARSTRQDAANPDVRDERRAISRRVGLG